MTYVENLLPYLKLCQLVSQSKVAEEVYYLEDCDGSVLVNNPTFPLVLQCEVIEFISEDAFKNRGRINSFTAVNVTLPEAPLVSIRRAVYDILKADFPNLVEEDAPVVVEEPVLEGAA